MTDLPTPCCSVHSLSSFPLVYISVLNTFLSKCFLSHLITCPTLPVPVQSSLRNLFGSLHHFRCSPDVFVPDLVFMPLHTSSPLYHPHLVHLNPFSCRFWICSLLIYQTCTLSNLCKNKCKHCVTFARYVFQLVTCF